MKISTCKHIEDITLEKTCFRTEPLPQLPSLHFQPWEAQCTKISVFQCGTIHHLGSKTSGSVELTVVGFDVRFCDVQLGIRKCLPHHDLQTSSNLSSGWIFYCKLLFKSHPKKLKKGDKSKVPQRSTIHWLFLWFQNLALSQIHPST